MILLDCEKSLQKNLMRSVFLYIVDDNTGIFLVLSSTGVAYAYAKIPIIIIDFTTFFFPTHTFLVKYKQVLKKRDKGFLNFVVMKTSDHCSFKKCNIVEYFCLNRKQNYQSSFCMFAVIHKDAVENDLPCLLVLTSLISCKF